MAAAEEAPSPTQSFGDPMHGGTLVVWDYDWSLINTNSDTFVIEELRSELMERFDKARSMGWTELMDYQMQGLFEQGVKREELVECVSGVPVFEGSLAAIRLCAEKEAEQMVLSDANTVFIEAFLERQGLQPLFRGVVTNAAEFDDDGRLHVRAYHAARGDPPHTCPLCPPNLCKGLVLERIRAELKPAKVIYVGDGGGDFCPCCDLLPGDAVLCRTPPSPPLQSFGLHNCIQGKKATLRTRHDGGQRPAKVVAQVHPWHNGEGLLEAMTAALA